MTGGLFVPHARQFSCKFRIFGRRNCGLFPVIPARPHDTSGEPALRQQRSADGPSRANDYWAARKGGRIGMKTGTMTHGIHEALEIKAAELDRVLRKRDDIAIEKSADQMEITLRRVLA